MSNLTFLNALLSFYLQVIRFLAIACLPSALLTAIHYILLYCITYDVAYLFSVRIHGFLPFCAAVVVTVKQLLPQSILFSTSFGRLKNDDIPLTVLGKKSASSSWLKNFFHLH